MSPTEAAPDPIIAAEVERALAPYRSQLTSDQLITLGEALEHALSTHPVGVALVERVRPRAVPERSEAQAKEDTASTRPSKTKRKAR